MSPTSHREALLGIFAILLRMTISFVMSVRLSAWNNSAPSGHIIIKFDIRVFFEILPRKSVSLKYDKNNRHFTLTPIYIFYHISLISS